MEYQPRLMEKPVLCQGQLHKNWQKNNKKIENIFFPVIKELLYFLTYVLRKLNAEHTNTLNSHTSKSELSSEKEPL